MQALRFLSFKTLVVALVMLIVLGFIPETLYSQTATIPSNPATANTHTPSDHARPSQRSTTSMPATPPSQTKAQTNPQTPAPPSTAVTKPELSTLKRPSLITQAVLLSLLSLLPFIIMILTSFLKIVVVLSLLRSALGVQQAPPNQVINGVAFLLSLFIMYPTGVKMYEAAQSTINQRTIPDSFLSPESSTYVIEVASAASEPLKDFLKRNSSGRHQALFYRLVYRSLPEDYRATLKPDDFIILVPSYITGQLKDAFEIGVLIYIPFFVIDLVTSNILLAMGMMMLSPVTISMPLKLFLLVMLDGWTILIEGLVKTFQ
jgi:type III secretion protein R